MDYKTHTARVFGETLTFLDEPARFPARRLRGDWMTDQRLLDRRGTMDVHVTPDGLAWSADPLSLSPQGYLLDCERWGDMERIGKHFCPDAGEFDRAEINPKLCGSLASDA